MIYSPSLVFHYFWRHDAKSLVAPFSLASKYSETQLWYCWFVRTSDPYIHCFCHAINYSTPNNRLIIILNFSTLLSQRSQPSLVVYGTETSLSITQQYTLLLWKRLFKLRCGVTSSNMLSVLASVDWNAPTDLFYDLQWYQLLPPIPYTLLAFPRSQNPKIAVGFVAAVVVIIVARNSRQQTQTRSHCRWCRV